MKILALAIDYFMSRYVVGKVHKSHKSDIYYRKKYIGTIGDALIGHLGAMTTVPPRFFDGKCLHKFMLFILYSYYYYVIFQSYFQSTTDTNLADFVETHEQTIIANYYRIPPER
jgi:hypothetical protein